jgi:hypothetical protein
MKMVSYVGNMNTLTALLQLISSFYFLFFIYLFIYFFVIISDTWQTCLVIRYCLSLSLAQCYCLDTTVK